MLVTYTRIWTKLPALNWACEPLLCLFTRMTAVPLEQLCLAQRWLCIGVCERCHIVVGKCTYKTPPEAWDPADSTLTCGFLAAHSTARFYCITVVAGDVNVRLKMEHCTRRMTFAAMPMSKAVMCQTVWKCAARLPKIFLRLKRVWRACPAEQSPAIQWTST